VSQDKGHGRRRFDVAVLMLEELLKSFISVQRLNEHTAEATVTHKPSGRKVIIRIECWEVPE
jgi:hypothetical protein